MQNKQKKTCAARVVLSTKGDDIRIQAVAHDHTCLVTLLDDLSESDSHPQEEIHVTASKTRTSSREPAPVGATSSSMCSRWQGRRTRLAIRLLLIYCRRRSRCSSGPSLHLSALFPVSFYKPSSKDSVRRGQCARTVLTIIHTHCA